MLVAADVHRPAAIDQLKILGEKVLRVLVPLHFFRIDTVYQIICVSGVSIYAGTGMAWVGPGWIRLDPTHFFIK